MELMEESEVVLLGWQLSMFGARVRIALAEKGIKYEYKEEVLPHDKSYLLLKFNPVHKKIPVLIHKGRPVCESKIIVEYIDEVWKGESPLLPSDAYLKSKAKFWADYIDKISEVGMKLIRGSKGEEMQIAGQELLECLKVLDCELGEKQYFIGETFGFVDIALMSYYHHFYTYETLGSFSVKNDCPKLFAWATKCMERESVSNTLPCPLKIYEAAIIFRLSIGLKD
ncbi:hypothetical protein L1887_22539 [Cichorium endivia]|nr:hypothetical protein L1887_22539 [Cichorium endivia]